MTERQDIIDKTYQFAKGHHAKDSSGHDFEHIRRVYVNAEKILQKEIDADVFLVKMAVLLHDVDDWKMDSSGNVAKSWLHGLDLPDDAVERILKIIDSIGFGATGENPSFNDIESKVVYDADKLDALGAIGIIRPFMVAGAKGFALFNPDRFPDEKLDMSKYNTKEYTSTNHTINHFFDKILKLKKLMQTETGKQEAEHRHEVIVAFLQEFFAEQNLADWSEYLQDYLNKKEGL